MENPAHEIAELRKAGKLKEAQQHARSAMSADPEDLYVESAYGWVIYEMVKGLIAQFESGDLPPSALARGLEDHLHDYANLGTQKRPDLLYSLLLNQACHAAKVWRGFVGFVFWGGLAFRDEDREPFKMDGKTLPSLELKVHYALGKGILRFDQRPDIRDWAWGALRKEAQSRPNDVWLRYYSARIHLKNGDAAGAFTDAVFVARKKREESWALAVLGSCCNEQGDVASAVACYREAIHLARKPIEVLKVREDLARLLWQHGDKRAALKQAGKVVAFREAHGYKVSDTVRQMAEHESSSSPREAPFPSTADKHLLEQLFRRGRVVVSTKLVVVEHHNPGKALTWVRESLDEGFPLFHKTNPEVVKWDVGSVVEASFDSEGELISVQPSARQEIAGLVKEVSGTLVFAAGKDFAFVRVSGGDDVYVPQEIALGWRDHENATVTARALRVRNKAKGGVPGWRAVSLEA